MASARKALVVLMDAAHRDFADPAWVASSVSPLDACVAGSQAQ